MADTPNKIWMVLEGNHYALKRGDEVIARLSFDDVLAIVNNATNFQQTIMSQMKAGAVYATRLQNAAADWDALGTEVLVHLWFQPNGTATYSLSPDHAEKLAQRLLALAANPPSFHSSN